MRLRISLEVEVGRHRRDDSEPMAFARSEQIETVESSTVGFLDERPGRTPRAVSLSPPPDPGGTAKNRGTATKNWRTQERTNNDGQA